MDCISIVFVYQAHAHAHAHALCYQLRNCRKFQLFLAMFIFGNSCIQHPQTWYKHVNSMSYGTHTLWEDSMTYETHIMRRITHISNGDYCKPRGTVAWNFQWIWNQINAQKFPYCSLRMRLWYFQWIRNKKFTDFITTLFSLFFPPKSLSVKSSIYSYFLELC